MDSVMNDILRSGEHTEAVIPYFTERARRETELARADTERAQQAKIDAELRLEQWRAEHRVSSEKKNPRPLSRERSLSPVVAIV